MGFGFAFIGEAVATSIIGKLVDTAYAALEGKLLPAGNVEKALKSVEHALPQVKAVLGVIESDEIKNQNKALTSWMWQFRDAIDCAEDVLDEMTYYELEEKIKSQNQKASGSKRKFPEFSGSKFKNDNHSFLRRLEKAVEELGAAASSVHDFLDLEKGLSRFRGKNYEDKNIENDRETGSMITENVVLGREKERDSIIEWLTSDPSDSGNATLSAFTIYGIGGLGKTTLAQLVLDDRRVTQFFGPIIWVCVSDQFNAVTIIAKILKVMSQESSLTTLQGNLKEYLMKKRFLLVLDDVWNDENRSQWEKLVAPLKFGYGRILVTTRMESVADMVSKVIKGKTDRFKLDGLEEKEFLMLFNTHAFDGADPDEFRSLLPIGKQIAKKLGGCPLAAKIMGGVLNYDIEREYWNKVLTEDLPDFQAGKDDIMAVLRLSYCHLPTYLQLCFRYCSIFPKNYGFTMDELIKMWMGSGLIEHVLKKQMPEDVGREYFNRLVRKSFFDLKSEKLYGMHDLLHDLAQSVSEGECLGIEGSSSDIPRTIRHLSFTMKNLLAIREISHLKSLRTLHITFEGDNPDFDDIQTFGEVLIRFKSLRLLKIKITWEGMFKVPDAVGELIHPAMDKLPWFPMSIYKLYHLELIKFKAAYIYDMDENEATGLINLSKLRYVDVGSEIIRQIMSIGKLTFLQELESFHIGSDNGHKISELRDLRSLRKLVVTNLDKVCTPQEAKEAKLNVKENLNSLSLSWAPGNSITNNTPATHEQLLDNLQPHKHLQELIIHEFGGMRCPLWMTPRLLVHLISLELYRCSLMASLPILGELPMLKHLTLISLRQVRRINQSFYGNDIKCAFPVLKSLKLHGMDELEDWDEVQGIILFPRMEKLVVSLCPKLRRLLDLPPSLKQLDIDNVGLEILPKIYPSDNTSIILPSSLSYLSVRNCRNLTSLNGCMLQQHGRLQALSKLFIDKCERLISPPSRGFIDCTSLKDITISRCPGLTGAPGTQENLLSFSLQKLTIGHSGLDIPLLRSTQNCTALTELKLNGCRSISSLPPFEILTKLIALNHLSIGYCSELSSLGGLEALTSLRFLKINNCDRLTTMSSSQPPLSANDNNSNPLRLNRLIIDRSTLLLLHPLRTLRFTEGLRITDASDLMHMPEGWLLQNQETILFIHVEGATNLEELPSCMDKLRLLDHLEIDDAPLIESLPDLPLSLNDLWITGCHPVLKERYEKDTGPEWYRVAYISTVVIM